MLVIIFTSPTYRAINNKYRKTEEPKYWFDNDGNIKIEVIKGKVDMARAEAKYQVDGLSGATITARGVSNMLHYWLGANGFGPYLTRLKG